MLMDLGFRYVSIKDHRQNVKRLSVRRNEGFKRPNSRVICSMFEFDSCSSLVVVPHASFAPPTLSTLSDRGTTYMGIMREQQMSIR